MGGWRVGGSPPRGRTKGTGVAHPQVKGGTVTGVHHGTGGSNGSTTTDGGDKGDGAGVTHRPAGPQVKGGDRTGAHHRWCGEEGPSRNGGGTGVTRVHRRRGGHGGRGSPATHRLKGGTGVRTGGEQRGDKGPSVHHRGGDNPNKRDERTGHRGRGRGSRVVTHRLKGGTGDRGPPRNRGEQKGDKGPPPMGGRGDKGDGRGVRVTHPQVKVKKGGRNRGPSTIARLRDGDGDGVRRGRGTSS